VIGKENQDVRNDCSLGETGAAVNQANQNLWDVNDVAQYLGLARGSIYHLVSRKEIPVIKISARCIRFSKKAIDAWLARRSHPSRSEAGTPP